MKIGILLFIIGIIIVAYLLNLRFNKKVLKQVGIIFGILMVLYGLIQIVQPNDNTYIKFTQTTIANS
ncbi:hypothetical protein MNB_ARC-1_764 [hydrothermal vent metagenome]|uniref:Uncharacterized protein n=1 Tax=hydrothermal vent metagenome TaxID=652676 RepID=A0A3B1E5D2_9ZZZZ